jgi:ATP-dependent DNA helicase 2 subunit 2
MSALARAMERKGVAALTRAVWTQNSDKVSFGALTPHIIPEAGLHESNAVDPS